MYCAELYAGITTVTAGELVEEPATLSGLSVQIVMNHLSRDDGTTGARLSAGQPRIGRQPFLAHCLPFITRALPVGVTRNGRSELGALEQAHGPCSHCIVVISRHQQARLLVGDDAANSTGARRYHRHACSKRLQYRTGHIVD